MNELLPLRGRYSDRVAGCRPRDRSSIPITGKRFFFFQALVMNQGPTQSAVQGVPLSLFLGVLR
jgi:hypothetical protein